MEEDPFMTATTRDDLLALAEEIRSMDTSFRLQHDLLLSMVGAALEDRPIYADDQLGEQLAQIANSIGGSHLYVDAVTRKRSALQRRLVEYTFVLYGGEMPPLPTPNDPDCEERVRALQAQLDALQGRFVDLFNDLNTVRAERDQALDERDEARAQAEANLIPNLENDAQRYLREYRETMLVSEVTVETDAAVAARDRAQAERDQMEGARDAARLLVDAALAARDRAHAERDQLNSDAEALAQEVTFYETERDEMERQRDEDLAQAARNATDAGGNDDCPEQLRQARIARDIAVQALDTALEERNRAIADVANADDERDAAEFKIENLEEAVLSGIEVENQHLADILEITEALTRVTAQAEGLRGEVATAQAEIQRLLESAQISEDVAVNVAAEIQTKLNARDVELQECNKARTTAEAEIVRLSSALNEEQRGAFATASDNERDAALQDCIKTRTTAQAEVERLSNELQAADDVAEALRIELAQAITDSLESENARATAQAEFDRVTTEIADLVRQIADLEAAEPAALEQDAECQAELERLNGLLAAANEEIGGLRAIRDVFAGVIGERAPELDDRVQELEEQIRGARGERDGCNEAANRELRLLRDCLKANGRSRRSDAPSPNSSSSSEEDTKTSGEEEDEVQPPPKRTRGGVKDRKILPRRNNLDSSIDVKSDDSKDLDYQPPSGNKRKAANDDGNKKSRKRR